MRVRKNEDRFIQQNFVCNRSLLRYIEPNTKKNVILAIVTIIREYFARSCYTIIGSVTVRVRLIRGRHSLYRATGSHFDHYIYCTSLRIDMICSDEKLMAFSITRYDDFETLMVQQYSNCVTISNAAKK